MRTMFVFANSHDAEFNGFHNGVHRVNPEWYACWPGCSLTMLSSKSFQAVIVSSHADVGYETGEGKLRDILEKRQSIYSKPVWMEP